MATLSFAGICTDAEIERQTERLLEIVKDDPTAVVDGDESDIMIFQYNAPGTLPWRRRNEVAILIKEIPDAVDADTETAVVGKEDKGETAVVGKKDKGNGGCGHGDCSCRKRG